MKLNITVQLLIVLLKTYVYILTDRTVWKVSPKGFGEKSFVAWSQLCLWIKDEKITILPFCESKSSKITGVFCSCVLRSSGMFSKLLETVQIAGVLNLAVSTFPNITIVKNGAKMLETFICQSMHTLNSKLKTVHLHYVSVLKKQFKPDGPHRQSLFRLSIIQPVIITE